RDKVVSMVATAGSAKHYLIPQQQLQPILSYMKAQVVQTYAFVEEKDLHRNQIVNDDVIQRLDRLAEDTIVLTRTYSEIREAADAASASDIRLPHSGFAFSEVHAGHRSTMTRPLVTGPVGSRPSGGGRGRSSPTVRAAGCRQ